MRESKLCDLPVIITILEDHYGEGRLEGIEFYLSTKIKNKAENSYLISDDNNILIIFERIGVFKAQFHIYTLGKQKGLKIRKFFEECFDYICENYNYTSFITFVPKDMQHAEMACGVIGCKYLGVVENAGGDTPEKLYTLTRETYKRRAS